MRAARTISLLSALLGALSLAPVSRGAPKDLSKDCIQDEARKAMSKCPGGPSKFDVKAERKVAFKSAPPPREAKKRVDKTSVREPGAEMEGAAQRDQRQYRLKARARALLISEISGLENLFVSTPKKSPDRAQLLRRLAEGYVELESAAVRDKIQSEIKVEDSRRKKKRNSEAKMEAAKANQIAKASREKAIKYYTKMKDEYPNYSKLDEVLYYLAYEYEQAKDLQNARKVYFELIEKAPKSPYIPNAYLAFGELFFQEAQGDPSAWDLAEQSYLKVIEYPAPNNKVYGYAHYKLGYVYWNKNDYKKALSQFKKVIDYGEQFAQLPNAKQLQKAARRDLIPVYAISGQPDAAYEFLKPLSGDKGGDEKTIDMMNELGFAYLDTGHYPEGIILYRDLMKRDKGKRYCLYQTQITKAISASKSSDKDAIVKELDTQIGVNKEFQSGSAPSKERLQCSNDTAELLSETAMAWHLEAVGSGGVRGTGDVNTMDRSSKLYKKVVDNFNSKDFARFTFPRIVKEDWPTIYKIRYAMADLLYFQKKWKECGPAFDSVVAENPTGNEAAEAAYAAVLCYQKMYDEMHQGQTARKGKGLGPKGAGKEDQKAKTGEWEKFKPKEFSELQKGMLTAFDRYVCYIKPPKGDNEKEEQYVEVKYARARTYFEAQHWEEAALGFRDVALNHSNKDAGMYAAQLYLEAMNVLGSRAEPARPACFTDMANDVPAFLELYCQGKKKEDNKDQCELLNRIQFDVRRLAAERIVEKADKEAETNQYAQALETYKKGGDAYLALWRTYCEGPLSEKKKVAECERADEILYNMAKAYQAGRLLAKSIVARKILLDEKYGLEKKPLALKSIYEIGGNYQAIAVYDQAAHYYELYAQKTQYKGENADKGMADAVVLRLGLGQEDEAIKDSKDFNAHYGAKKPAETARIAFAVAAHYGEKGDWKNVVDKLNASMRMIDTKATPDVQVQAHALLARAYAKTKREPNAAGEYKKVLSLWSDPKKAAGAIASAAEDEAAKTRSLGRALEAVGEAQFYFAEQARTKLDKLEFPAYKGKGVKDEVLKHIGTKVKDWYEKKGKIIQDVSAEYKKVVDLQPVPPPRWVIAAGSRVGEVWGTFVKEFRAAPIPVEWKKDAEIRNTYYAALDEKSEPWKKTAKEAYGTCLDYSVKYQYFDEYSRACEEWLAQNYKNEFHLIDEFRGAPSRVNSALREQAYPLRIGGEPLVVGPKAGPIEKVDKKEEEKAPADKDKGKGKGKAAAPAKAGEGKAGKGKKAPDISSMK
jgi:TolA-binding protein